MRDMGIRGRFAYGPAQGMPDDQVMDHTGLARIKREWMPKLAAEGVLCLPPAPNRLRLVLHADIDDDQAERAIPVRAGNRVPATVTGIAARAPARAAETASPAPAGTAVVRLRTARAVAGPQAADRGSRSITRCRAASGPA